VLCLHPDEVFYPVSPTYALDRSALMRHDASGDDIQISNDPTVSMVSSLTNPDDGYFLDNRRGTVEDDGILEDFKASEPAPTVHARVTSAWNGGYAVQYWFFYPFNDGALNRHEGDWEMVTVLLDSSREPTEVGYSQHYGGEGAEWSMVETSDGHPKVYVALGSHANYLRSYEGALGLASDKVSASGRLLSPDDYGLVNIGEAGEGGWLDFAGFWGEYGSEESGIIGERGPQGPAYFTGGDRWNEPSSWVAGLDEASEAKFQASWWLVNFIWVALGIMLISMLVRVYRIWRLKRRQGTLGPRLVPWGYMGGSNAKTIGLALSVAAIALALVAFFLPWYTVSINVEAGDYATGGPVDIIQIDGAHGVRFSMLQTEAGLAQLFSIPIPLAWLMVFGLLLFFLSTVGLRESKKMGNKFIGRGVGTIMTVFTILMVVAGIASGISQAVGDEAPNAAVHVLDTVAANPAFGSESATFGDYGYADLSWGLGSGAYLLIIAGLMYIASGILQRSAKCNYYELPGQAPAQPYAPQGQYAQQPGYYGPQAQANQPAQYQQQPYYPAQQPAQPQYGQPPHQYPPQQAYGPQQYSPQAQPSQYPPQGYQPAQTPPRSMTCPYCRANITLSGSTQPFPCPGCGNTMYPPQQ
jgi:hypothetical protein